MTAEQARQISDENSDIKIEHSLEDVYSLIKEEAKKGKLFVEIGNIGENTSKKLLDDGFAVEWFRDRTKDYDITFKITWQIV